MKFLLCDSEAKHRSHEWIGSDGLRHDCPGYCGLVGSVRSIDVHRIDGDLMTIGRTLRTEDETA